MRLPTEAPIRELIALAALVLGACAEPNLGDSPFFCNNGLPECPEGYECDRPGGPGTAGRCVRPGSVLPLPPDAAVPDQPTPDLPQTADLPQVKPDTRKPDGPAVKWDTGPIDMPPLKPDGIPPHLGCQSNTECTDVSYPCCCPTPLLPMIWSCLPFCFDPFCF